MLSSKRTLQVMMLGGLLLVAVAATAIAQQHENHSGGAAGPAPAGAAPACCGNMPNAGSPAKLVEPAAGMSSMGMSSCPHMQAGALANQLLTSFAALEAEQDVAALKLKLSAHGNLLKQLKATTDQKCPMMEHMGGASGGMMGMPGMQHPTPAK